MLYIQVGSARQAVRSSLASTRHGDTTERGGDDADLYVLLDWPGGRSRGDPGRSHRPKAEAQGFGFSYNSPGLSIGVNQPAYYGGYYPAPVIVPRPVVIPQPLIIPGRPYYGGAYGYRGGYGGPHGGYYGPRGGYGYGHRPY